jgi:hypothetical protein
MTTYADPLYPFWFEAYCNSENFKARWAYDAIERYVLTGRAYAGWEAALKKASPAKLLAYMASAQDCSSDGLLAVCNKYLRRHCGLDK